jgi:hypothetical protein
LTPPAVPSRAPAASAESPTAELWRSVDRLIDRAPSVLDLRAHKLHLLAVARYRSTGRAVPADLEEAARSATLAAFAAPLLLERVRAVVDGPLVLLKGPEVAARYPGRALRPFGDLDLLARDPVGVQRALLAEGFTLVGDESLYREIHHLRPLHYASYPLVLEIHARPKWIDSAPGPPVEELFEAAVPAAVGVDGILAPAPAHHALLLAAHSWAHAPLGQLIHLVDVAALRTESSAAELEQLARRWRVERLWSATDAAADALLLGGPKPLPLRVWARNLQGVRHRTVLETHLERWLAGFSILPFRRACGAATRAVARDLRPAPGETWRIKLRRTRRALGNAFVRRAEHDTELASLEASRKWKRR